MEEAGRHGSGRKRKGGNVAITTKFVRMFIERLYKGCCSRHWHSRKQETDLAQREFLLSERQACVHKMLLETTGFMTGRRLTVETKEGIIVCCLECKQEMPCVLSLITDIHWLVNS